MSLKVGIVGLPNVGKSTLFQALTKKQVDVANYPFATIEPNIGIVEVADERLGRLGALSKSKKIIPAVIEFVDIAGLVRGAHEGEGLGNQFLAHIREVDAIVEVVRNFHDPNIIHVEASINPERDKETIGLELIMADLGTAQKALTRAEKDAKTGTKDSRTRLEETRKLCEELKNAQTPSNRELARSLQLLSAKPILYLYNTKDGTENSSRNTHHLRRQNGSEPRLSASGLSLNIKLEEELARMTREEQKELGIESQLWKLAQEAYKLLDLISFFTTGEDETRAWTIPAGSTAKRAGRAIHSDFEEKFIRAEVILWRDLLNAGSYAAAREGGLLRTEGKDYIVKDGDVIEFKI